MNCDEALQIMINADQTQQRQALDYIMRHPNCLVRLDQFARAILSDLEDELSCAEARTHLPAYYELTTQQADVEQKLPLVLAHLARCPYCMLEYELLQTSMHELAAGRLSALDKMPTFDFSFLPQADTPPALWIREEDIRTFVQNISITIGQSIARISPVAGLTPTATMGTLRSGLHENIEEASQNGGLVLLHLPDRDANMGFQLEAIANEDDTAVITLRIYQADPHNPIPNARILLCTREGHPLHGKLTEEDGTVLFEDLSRGQYLIQIRFQSEHWEIPLVLTALA